MFVLFCSCEDLHTILAKLNYLPPLDEGQASPLSKEFLLELLVSEVGVGLGRTVREVRGRTVREVR
jgi:hypothetical protein